MTTPDPIEILTLNELDTLIALTYADIPWHSPTYEGKARQAIDELLDRRLKLTQA